MIFSHTYVRDTLLPTMLSSHFLKVLKSTLESIVPFNLPLLGDSSAFPSGSALELVRPGSSTVYMRTTYIDDNLRISRNDADNKIFIFKRSD